MSSTFDFDLIIIGGGPAGYEAAIRAAQLGLKTACVEKRKAYGGTCLNVGCIPSKALLDSSEHFHFASHKASKHGVNISGVSLDLGQMMKRKDDIVRQLTTGVGGLLKKNKIESIIGTARFHEKIAGGGAVLIVESASGESRQIRAPKILIATGSEPMELPFLPYDGKRILSSTEALSIPEVPKHLCVIGGGVIGLELGSVWSRLGAKVTVVEFQARLVPMFDHQMGEELRKSLIKQGLTFQLETECKGATASKDPSLPLFVQLKDRKSGEESQIPCDYVLVATGRRPNTDGLGAQAIGLTLDKAGRVQINDHFQTEIPGIYAVGDVVRGAMLAHKASEEGVAAVELMKGHAGHVNYGAIPNVVYTWPELASVGQTEEELKAAGKEVRIGTFPFMANGRAKAMDEAEGLVKVIADAKTDRVLGVHIFGPRASDMIAEAVTVLEFGGSAEDIARTSHGHPTLSEALKEAALDVAKRRRNL